MSTETEAKVLDPDAADGEPVRVAVPDISAPAADDDDVIVSPVAGLEDLQRQLADKTREADALKASERAARAQAAESARIANEAMQRGVSTHEVLIGTQLDIAQKEVEALTSGYEQALSSGDYGEVAKINAQLMRATARAERLETDKTHFSEQRERMVQEQRAPADPVEATIAQLSPASQAWMREHVDLVKPTGGVKGKLIDAHEAAIEAGCAPDTPEYFSHVEQELGLGGDPEPAPLRQAPAPARRPAVSAPVSRRAPNAPVTAGTVTLKAHHRDAAQTSGITDAQYAARAVAMIKSGELPANFLD